jgi:Putative peptidoglycan binding domain
MSMLDRPTIGNGDYGSLVLLVQECLRCDLDSTFGPETEKAVKAFQDDHDLENDGIVGPATWDKLEEVYDLPPYPAPMLKPLPRQIIHEIGMAAVASDVSELIWDDRGVAPLAYTKGMALAYATCVRKFQRGDMTMHEIAKAETGDTDHDALALYRDKFRALGMRNDVAGRDVLRSVFVFLLGLGMRESSGEHCCGRDQSAENVQSDTCEAGLFQTSWNYHVCAIDAEMLFDEYYHALSREEPQCLLGTFEDGVTCDNDDWENYGSGEGAEFQELSKVCPAFAVESAAVGIRNLRKHWGPIGRMEVQITSEAEDLFKEIDEILALGDAGAPAA